MKRVLSVLIALLMALSLVACGSKSTKEGSVTVSDELKDFTFILDNKVYQLPFDYSTLVEDGWTLESPERENSKLQANSYEKIRMVKADSKVDVVLINLSGNAKQLSECKIGGIEVSNYYLSDSSLFKIAKGITVDSSEEDIINAFGNPDNSKEDDDYTLLSYYLDEHNRDVNAYFVCYKKDTQYNTIKLENYVKGEEDETQTSTEVPEYLSTYVAPTELGDSNTSSTFELEGVYYTLPAPVSVFTDNGWKITSKSGSVGAGGDDSLKIKKDGNEISVYITNLAEYQTIPENCAVYWVKVDESEKVSIVLPGKITIGSSKADVEKWVSDKHKFDEGNISYSYTYSDYSGGIFSIEINVNKKTEKVSHIEVINNKWPK